MKHTNKGIVCSVMAIIALVVGTSDIKTESIKPIGEVKIANKVIGELAVSQQALEIIGNAEGCRLKPYACPAGLPTDGIGNTHNVTGKVKNNEQVAIDWVGNVQSSERCLVASMGGASMSQGQFDAFTSFIFNTGCSRFMHNANGSDTRIYKHIKAGRYKNACNELRFWVYAGGKKFAGLVNRRRKEMERCFVAD